MNVGCCCLVGTDSEYGQEASSLSLRTTRGTDHGKTPFITLVFRQVYPLVGKEWLDHCGYGGSKAHQYVMMMVCRGQIIIVSTLLLLGSGGAWKPPTFRSVSLSTLSRRDVFQAIAVGVGGLAVLSPDRASARDELFKKNPLTSPILEQIRIWDQAEADELKYNGELERGDAGNKGKVEAYPRLLVPILAISNDLDQIDQLLSKGSSGMEEWKQARQILSKPEFEKINFKKIFNRYGDNVSGVTNVSSRTFNENSSSSHFSFYLHI